MGEAGRKVGDAGREVGEGEADEGEAGKKAGGGRQGTLEGRQVGEGEADEGHRKRRGGGTMEADLTSLLLSISYKFWSCCCIKTMDFNSFLDQKGCSSGKHCWVTKRVRLPHLGGWFLSQQGDNCCHLWGWTPSP